MSKEHDYWKKESQSCQQKLIEQQKKEGDRKEEELLNTKKLV